MRKSWGFTVYDLGINVGQTLTLPTAAVRRFIAPVGKSGVFTQPLLAFSQAFPTTFFGFSPLFQYRLSPPSTGPITRAINFI